MLEQRKASYRSLLRDASEYMPLSEQQEFQKLREMAERETIRIYFLKVM
jgi:hypothetical protein